MIDRADDPPDCPKRPIIVTARHPAKVKRPAKAPAQPLEAKPAQIVRARKPRRRIPGEPIIWKGKKDRTGE